MKKEKKLAIITTHPIQYNAPFFKEIAKNGKVGLMVFYTWDKGVGEKHDPGFGKSVEWDVPLLDGYPYTFVRNVSPNPGSHHYKGIVCPSLITEIEQFQPDAILIYGWNFYAHLKAMRYFKGKVPVWFRGDSTLLDYNFKTIRDIFRKNNYTSFSSQPLNFNSFISKAVIVPCLRVWGYIKYTLRRLYLTHIYRSIDKAFYVGANNKAYYLVHGLKEEELVSMPHAVDNEFFSRDAGEMELEALVWRRSLGIGDDEFVVLFAGKFEPKKNPELLVNAVIEINENIQLKDSKQQNQEFNKQQISSNLQILISSNSRIHLILVGNGILEPKLKEMASGKDYIHFLPFQNQSNMSVVYRLGNVFCLSSISETWGLAVNEAMASGRPVIASDKVGGAVDLISEGINGYIFQSNNRKELQGKIALAREVGEFDRKRLVETVKEAFNLVDNARVLEESLFQLQKEIP